MVKKLMQPFSGWHSVSSRGLGFGENCDSAGPYKSQPHLGGVPIGVGGGKERAKARLGIIWHTKVSVK